jgi:hypothetical protein
MAVYRYKKEDLKPNSERTPFANKAWLMAGAGVLFFVLLIAIVTKPQKQTPSTKEQVVAPAGQNEAPSKEKSIEVAQTGETGYKCFWKKGGSQFFETTDSKSCREVLANHEEQNKKPVYSKEQCKTAKEDLARAERDRKNYEVGAYATGAKLDGWGADADYSIYEKEKEKAEKILYYCK